jgi:SHAQKYF class myb-like DNA-binding protein
MRNNVATGRCSCSHCGSYGHASTACCGAAGPRLFGVQLRAAASSPELQLHKSYSVDCLTLQGCSSAPHHLAPLFSPSSALLLSSTDEGGETRATDGYLSDEGGGRGGAAASREKRKGVPWSEQEHRLFLAGLEKLGRGDWRGISRGFVTTRTPTQVASHAQKFFLRRDSAGKKNNAKRRSSLFDMVLHNLSRHN